MALQQLRDYIRRQLIPLSDLGIAREPQAGLIFPDDAPPVLAVLSALRKDTGAPTLVRTNADGTLGGSGTVELIDAFGNPIGVTGNALVVSSTGSTMNSSAFSLAAATNLTNGSFTNIPWDTVGWDDLAAHNNVDNTRLQLGPGTFRIHVEVGINAVVGAQAFVPIQVLQAGVQVARFDREFDNYNTYGGKNVTFELRLAAATYIQIGVYCDKANFRLAGEGPLATSVYIDQLK